MYNIFFTSAPPVALGLFDRFNFEFNKNAEKLILKSNSTFGNFIHEFLLANFLDSKFILFVKFYFPFKKKFQNNYKKILF